MPNNSDGKRARDSGDDSEEERHAAKRTFKIQDFGNVITILVGATKQRFLLHEDILCAKSSYLRTMCSKHRDERREDPICLPYVEPALFKVYCSWIYDSKLPKGRCTAESTTRMKVCELNSLTNFCILGEQFDHLRLRNLAIVRLSESLRTLKPQLLPLRITLIWAQTIPGSTLRRLFVDYVLQSAVRGDIVKEFAKWPSEFVQEVLEASLGRLPAVSANIDLQIEHYVEEEL